MVLEEMEQADVPNILNIGGHFLSRDCVGIPSEWVLRWNDADVCKRFLLSWRDKNRRNL